METVRAGDSVITLSSVRGSVREQSWEKLGHQRLFLWPSENGAIPPLSHKATESQPKLTGLS